MSVMLFELAGCKRNETDTTPTPTPPNLAEQAKEYADAHPSINTPESTNHFPTSVKISLGSYVVGTYFFQYDSQKRLVKISNNNSTMFNISIDSTNPQIYQMLGVRYQLNEQGLAQNSNGVFSNGREAAVEYFYKNGYLVSSADQNYFTKLNYNTNGDLKEWIGLSHLGEYIRASYSYTNFPNTLQQEINYWTAPHFALRGYFLGKYSSHLVEKVTFQNAVLNNVTLDFSYSFDSQNRVTKVVIKRSLGDEAIYEYSY